jgi:3-hydroxybutyryl-CoA dehydrogenase
MPQEIGTVAVIGAGTMGAGIAQVVTLAGLRARLQDVSAEALARGVARVKTQIEDGVKRGKVAPDQAERAQGLLAGSTDMASAVSGADLVIEAVPEVLELKRATFTALDKFCPPPAILATNTSSLPIGSIASVLSDPSRAVGLHFFNPPHIMKLVEIVRGDRTSDAVLEATRTFVDKIGKTSILVKDSPGFATSRLGLALGLEAMRMLEAGVASATDIDLAMELGYGHPMGPLKVSDLVGLDVRLSIAEILHRELRQEQFRPPEILRRLVAEGRLGRKSGQGFHRWDEKKPSGS